MQFLVLVLVLVRSTVLALLLETVRGALPWDNTYYSGTYDHVTASINSQHC